MSAGEFEGYEALVAQLQAGALAAPGHLHRRVLAGAPSRRRRIAAMSARRRFFIALPAAATLAVGAAVVHGAFFNSSRSNSPYVAAHRLVTHAQARPLRPFRTTGANGATGLNGPTGAQGPTGAAGATGANGATGATRTYRMNSRQNDTVHGTAAVSKPGATGGPGPTGPQGPNGETGATGSTPQNAKYDQGTLEALTQKSAAYSAAQSAQSLFSSDGLTIPTGRLVHAEADLEVSVASHDALTRATNKARQIVTSLGGYSQNVQYTFSHNGYGRAYLDLRVPLGKTEVAIQDLEKLGQLVGQQVSTQDLEQQFKQETNQIDQLRRAIAIYKQALQNGTVSGAERVQVEIRLANAEHVIAGTRKAKTQTVKSGSTADIRLSLSTNPKGGGRPHKTGRLGQMLHNTGEFLGEEGIIILYVLISAVPVILLIAIIWWLVRERRRREEKLLAASA